MTKVISIGTSIQAKEAFLLTGMAGKNRNAQYELYAYCSDYFWKNYRGVFFAGENEAAEILQNSFITLWESIEHHKLYVEDGVVMGKDRKPLKGSILSYFMGIAKLKYLEWVRQNQFSSNLSIRSSNLNKEKEFDAKGYAEMLYDSSENVMLEIISDVISTMSPRCYEILTKFYYEEKSLDRILLEIPTFESKDALKTKKYKCMENLRHSAQEIYQRYLNS